MKPCPRCNRTIEEGAKCPACNPKYTMLDELEALRKEHDSTRALLVWLRFEGTGFDEDARVRAVVDSWEVAEKIRNGGRV